MGLMMRGEISIYGMIAILVADKASNHTYMSTPSEYNRLLRNCQLHVYVQNTYLELLANSY